MQIEPESFPHLRRHPGEKAAAMETALEPLLENPPKPVFTLRWDEEARLWCSQFAPPAELPKEISEVFDRFGYGCLAAETDIGVIHICHASNSDIEGFANKPVQYQWQLIKMPTAPLIRLELTIIDNPLNPYRFESFLNTAQEDQARPGLERGQDHAFPPPLIDDHHLARLDTLRLNHVGPAVQGRLPGQLLISPCRARILPHHQRKPDHGHGRDPCELQPAVLALYAG